MHKGGHRHRSFLRGVHFALMALGPWEGRAVAFVLGCEIGALRLRITLASSASTLSMCLALGEPDEVDVLLETHAEVVIQPQ
ncbi:hypothetical protein SCP_0116950 [Sparassis crispa]|uniref:Secreted protein n=1 Tax=Sparassis crispa TaxID=139825 RepID=A0A401G9G0_9APHY|nr:hypothetical protein SCP_0116950 [Sparassis crispa]GBE78802.1 hypothetical protein SCP_0116950 [Sparassis crispa]